MKVLHVIARVNRGGTATWLSQLIPGLKNGGIQTYLAAGTVQNEEIEDKLFLDFGGIRVTGLGRSISILQDLRAFFLLRKLIKKLRPDVVNTHTSKAGVIGRLAGLSLGKDRPVLVHTFHGHLLYGYFGKFKTKLIIFIERILMRFTDLAISSGFKVRDELLQVGIGTINKFYVIRPGIDKPELPSRSETLLKFNIPNNEFVIGWLGRVTEIKRPDRVIELARRLPGLFFVMGGEGNLTPEILKEAPSNLKLVGWIKPEEIWAISNMALITSDNEAQPMSLLEASLSELPSVAWDVGSVSEVVNDGITGFLVTNVEEAIHCISELSNQIQLCKRMGSEAQNFVKNNFNRQNFIESHILAYEFAVECHQIK